MKHLILFSLILFIDVCMAQWFGDTSRFKFTGASLHLNDNSENQSTILQPISSTIQTEMILSLDFVPSSSNGLNIYINTDSTLKNGFHIHVGETGDDYLRLIRRTDGKDEDLAKSESPLLTPIDNVHLIIKENAEQYVGVFQAGQDTTLLFGYYNSSMHLSYTGLECFYTKTRSNHFHFSHFNTQSSFIFPTHISTPTLISSGDVLISEILFDPTEEQGEFIELYNNSKDTLNLFELNILRLENGQTNQTFSLITSSSLAPNQTTCITDYSKWETPPSNCIDQSLFSLINDASTVLITNLIGEKIDAFTYSPKSHSVILNDTKGISLSKNNKGEISSTHPSPGYQELNSSLDYMSLKTPIIYTYSEPSLLFDYKFNCEHMCSCELLDKRGKPIHTLFSGEFLDHSGTISTTLPSALITQLSTNIYIVYCNLWNEEGNSTTNRYAITIAR